MSEPHRAPEVVSFFEDTVRRLRAERSDDDPLAIAEAAFAAVHARYGDLTEAEAERAVAIRQFNACIALFEAAHRRAPYCRDELDRWLITPQGGRAEKKGCS